MGYRLVDYQGTNHSLIDMEVTLSLKKLNAAEVKIRKEVPVDTDATLYKKVGEDWVAMFTGMIKSCTKGDDYLFTVCLEEGATTLQMSYVKDPNPLNLFPYKYIFKDTDKTINYVLDNIILPGSGFTRHPSCSDTTLVNPTMFYYMSTINALYKILKELKGYHVWFEGSYVGFGDRGGEVFPISKTIMVKPESDSYLRNVEKVIVVGLTDSIVGTAGTGNKMLVFKYDDAINQSEANQLASTILNRRSGPRSRLNVDLKPLVGFYEGQQVSLGGVTYTVQDVTMRFDKTTLGLAGEAVDIMDILGNKLHLLEGYMAAGSAVTYDSGWEDIDKDTFLEWKFTLNDGDALSNIKLNVSLDDIKQTSTNNSGVTDILNTIDGTGLMGLDANANILDSLNATGLSVLTMNAPPDSGSMFSANSTIVSLNNAFQELVRYDGYLASENGLHIALANLSVLCVSTDLAGLALINMQFEWSPHGEEDWTAIGGYPESGWIMADRSTNLFAQVMMGYRFGFEAGDYRWTARIDPDNSTINCLVEASAMSVHMMQRHDHATEEDDHNHPLEDDGHDHALDDPEHTHVTDDPSHTHDTSPGVHTTNIYPTNVNVMLFNTLYPEGKQLGTSTGGAEMTFNLTVEDTDFVTGENCIRLFSDTYGKANLKGTYMYFGA